MTIDNDALGGAQPNSDAATVTADNEAAKNAEAAKAAEAEGKTAEGDDKKPEAATDEAAEAAKATEAAKELNRRKQTASERIAQVTRKWRDAERREQDLIKERDEARAKLAEPDPAKFDDPAELTAAKVESTLDKREVNRLHKQATDARAEANSARLDAFHERAAEAREKFADFDDVVMKPAQLPMSQDTQSLVLEMDESAEVIYHLAKNPSEASRINRLSEREKAFELGKIASRITQAPPRKTTQAPTPVSAVAGKTSGGSGFNPATASVQEFSDRYRKDRESRA